VDESPTPLDAPPSAPSPRTGTAGVLHIVPGPYSAPMSIRAATRFARGGFPSLHASRTNRLAVLALIASILLAAGGIGSALAFRFGGPGKTAAPASHDPTRP